MKSTKHDTRKKQQLTEAASPKIVRKRLRWSAIAISAVASLVVATVAFGLTPANGGLVGGTTIAVNYGSGDQTEPHVSGNLAVYTDATSASASTIHYYDFLSTADAVVPPGVNGELDFLSDVNGSQIVFSRLHNDASMASLVYDVSTATLTDVAPLPGSSRFGVVIGNHVVAFAEFSSGNGDIMVYDLGTAGPLINLSASTDVDENPSISPSGNAVVWERCVNNNSTNCSIMRSLKVGAAWSSPEIVSGTLSNEANPDTDGTTVVYDSNRPSATDQDIYFQPLAGGPETQLQIPGIQYNPSISQGVIGFESIAPGQTKADIFVYVIATNTLWQVTNTPTVGDSLNDISVLSNGDVRVVWATDDDIVTGNHNINARTFRVPLGGDSTAPTVTITTPANGATYIKGQSVAADFSCQDETGGSGLASCTGPVINGNPIDTESVGSHSFSVTTTDNAGNSATATNTYNVVYNFNGFFQPVDNLPTLNLVTAGSSIPVKFSLSGNQGLAIFAAGFPASSQNQCDASEPGVVIEETVNAGGSSLNYNGTTDQYIYVWKTDRAWKGTCRMLVVKFNDGSQYFAKFRFR